MKKLTFIPVLLAFLFFNSSCKETMAPDPDPIPDNKDTITIPAQTFTKGVNLSDWFLANSAEEIKKDQYRKADLEQIKALGVDVVRLPVRFFMMTGEAPTYTISSTLFDKLDYALDIAEQVGLKIIIDNHSYFGSNPFPQAFGEDQMTKVWEQVATHCKGRSNLVYYELMNEPDGSYLKTNWGQIQGRMINAIRAIDTTHTIIVGAPEANSMTELKNLPVYTDKNLIYTFHFYKPFLFTHQGADWTLLKNVSGIPFPYNSTTMPTCPAELIGTGTWGDDLYKNYPTEGTVDRMKSYIDEAITFARERHVRLFCGEFGVLMTTVQNEQRCNWYKEVTNYLNENGISWTMWDYHNAFGLFVKGTSYRFETDLNVPLLNVLGFNVPASYLSDTPANIPFYLDELSQSMTDVSYDSNGQINFVNTSSPYEGKNSISWKVGGKWAAISINVWPVINLQKQFDAGYHLRFAIKNASPTKLQVRFVEYDTSTYPWRNSFNVTTDMVKTDGSWTSISIPLTSFKETGALAGSTWHDAQGLFSWEKVNKLEFAAEGNDALIGNTISIDSVVVAK